MTFRGLEEARKEETQRLVRAKHLSQLPTGASGQMGFLRGEMAKKRRHKPIRQIMRAAGQMVQRIKPVCPLNVGFDNLRVIVETRLLS